MSDLLNKTIRILKKPQENDPANNRNIWSGPIETDDFELVSTMMLQQILTTDDGSAKQQIERVAANDVEGSGVLAHHKQTDDYEIVDADGSEEFSLVTTQMLHRILKGDDVEDVAAEPLEVDSGFNPYNSG